MTGEAARRLRGAIGNALVWGAGWSAAAFVVISAMWLAGKAGDATWLDVLVLSIKFGVWGTIAGGAFSAVIGLLYRGRRLSEISVLRFGLGGALVTGIFVPLFMQLMNLLSGDGLVPWRLVNDDAVITAVFGGVAAAVSLKVAQRAGRVLPGGPHEELDDPSGADHLVHAGERKAGERSATVRTPSGS